MERYAPYNRPYFSGAWQLLCTASSLAASSQGHYIYGCLHRWLFCLGSHWKMSFVLSIYLEDGGRGVRLLYFWLSCVSARYDCPCGDSVSVHHTMMLRSPHIFLRKRFGVYRRFDEMSRSGDDFWHQTTHFAF